jgi:hypothetical protein
VVVTAQYQFVTVSDTLVEGCVHSAIPPLQALNPTIFHSMFARAIVDDEVKTTGCARIWMADLMIPPLPTDRAGFYGTSVKFALPENYSAFIQAFAQH